MRNRRPLPTPTGLDAPPPGFGQVRPRRGFRARHPGVEWLAAAVGLLIAGVILGPLLYFHVVEGRAPGRLSLPRVAGAGTRVAPGPVSGRWSVAGGSQAGFRVQEILFGQHHTAVGRTSGVTGGTVISGTSVVAADFTVNMATLETDQAGRNVQIHDYILKTGSYPHATFRLTRPIALGDIPPVGRPIVAHATGALTLRGVTRTVTFPLHAERVAGGIDVNAEIPIVYSHWHIPNPSFAIARVGNSGVIEVLLHLKPSP